MKVPEIEICRVLLNKHLKSAIRADAIPFTRLLHVAERYCAAGHSPSTQRAIWRRTQDEDGCYPSTYFCPLTKTEEIFAMRQSSQRHRDPTRPVRDVFRGSKDGSCRKPRIRTLSARASPLGHQGSKWENLAGM
jgi:hypothetical protein